MKKLAVTKWDNIRILYKPSENPVVRHNEECCSKSTNSQTDLFFKNRLCTFVYYSNYESMAIIHPAFFLSAHLSQIWFIRCPRTSPTNILLLAVWMSLPILLAIGGEKVVTIPTCNLENKEGTVMKKWSLYQRIANEAHHRRKTRVLLKVLHRCQYNFRCWPLAHLLHPLHPVYS